MQQHSTHIHQHKYSRAYNGDSVLDIPVDRILLSKGMFITYDGAKYKPGTKLPQAQQQRPPSEQADPSKDTSVVITALQRILRGKEDKPNTPFAEFGQGRPIR